jgi:hypothetical protein
MSIATLESFSFEPLIIFGDGYQQVHLFRIEESGFQQIAVAVELSDLLLG